MRRTIGLLAVYVGDCVELVDGENVCKAACSLMSAF